MRRYLSFWKSAKQSRIFLISLQKVFASRNIVSSLVRIYGAFRTSTFFYGNRWETIRFSCVFTYGKKINTNSDMNNFLPPLASWLPHDTPWLVWWKSRRSRKSRTIRRFSIKHCGPMTFSSAHRCPIPKTRSLGPCPMVEKSWIRHWCLLLNSLLF